MPIRTDRGARCRRARIRRRCLATSLASAAVFFAGAALSAGAGDATVKAGEEETTTAIAEVVASRESESSQSSSAIPPEPSADGGDPASEDASAASTSLEEVGSGGEPMEEADEPAAPEPAPDVADPNAGPEPAADPLREPPPERAAHPPADEAAAGAPAAGAGVVSPPAAPREAPAEPDTAAAPQLEAQAGAPLVRPPTHVGDQDRHAVDPETETAGAFATLWHQKALPDPTPPARRLSPSFARLLRSEARRARVDWAALMAAIRADGRDGRNPARRPYVRELARTLAARMPAGEWQAFFALRRRSAYAARAQALTRFHRAVGLRALVIGLDAAKRSLEVRVLADERIAIYEAGRGDIAAHRIDVRVLVVLRYLAEAHGQVTVSSLQSGHRLYARPGVVSAHVYGLAVDVAALGGQSVLGNSAPGGVTEQAVRNILLLPAELRPQQVISLLGLGGPSFSLANHADHIHVGF